MDFNTIVLLVLAYTFCGFFIYSLMIYYVSQRIKRREGQRPSLNEVYYGLLSPKTTIFEKSLYVIYYITISIIGVSFLVGTGFL